MNNKDFLNNLAARLETTPQDIQTIIEAFSKALSEKLEEGDTLAIQNFGSFEIKKKMDRILINPSTKQRMLVPPKLTIAFKASNTLKDKAQ